MPNLIKQIEDLSQKAAPIYSDIHVIPRGVPFYADPLLTGALRFAKKTGTSLAVWKADNQVQLTKAAITGNTSITINTTNSWVEPGQILLIDDSEKVSVDDYLPEDGTVTFDSKLLYPHDVGSNVSIWAFPIIVHQIIDPFTIRVRSIKGIYNGDVFAHMDINDNLFSFIETNILTSSKVGLYGTVPIYEIKLDKIVNTLKAGDMVYIRALPAYESPLLKLPLFTTYSFYLGPLVLDYLSFELKSNHIRETFSVQVHDVLGATTATPITVDKNYPVLNLPLDTTALLFWQKIKGTLNYDGNRVIAITDSEGLFSISTEWIPEVPPGYEWSLPVVSDADASVTCQFIPNTLRVYHTVGGLATSIPIGVASGEKSTSSKMTLSVRSTPNSQIKFGSWTTYSSNQADTIQYFIVSDAIGYDLWGSSALILKPFFMTLDHLKASFDRYSVFDSGKIFL